MLGDEICLVTAGAGTTTWTIVRGSEGSTATSHASGTSVFHVLTAASLLRSPGALTTTGDIGYLDSSGAPARLPAGSDGQYVRYLSGVPTASALLMADLSGSSIVYGTDTTFGRGAAAGQMTLSAGASSPSLRLQNGSNAELGCVYWDSHNFVLGTQGGVGAGTVRDTLLSSAANLILATEGTSRWTLDAASAHLRPWATATYDLGTASYVVRSAYVSKLGTLTADGFVKTSGGDGTLSVDTNTYLTSVTAHNVLSATHGDTVAASVTRGDVIIGNSTPKWARLAIGSASRYLSSDGTDVSWGQVSLTAGVTGTLPVANGGTGVTASTGSVAVVLSTSPTLVTPDLGVATATSVNKLTITAPATSATLTIADGKTFTVNQTLTLTGTTGTTMTFPATSATIARTDAAQTFTGVQTESNASLGTTSTDGVVLQNTTAAAAGAQQRSPRLRFSGQGWKTASTAASQSVDWYIDNLPVQGSANASGALRFGVSVAGGSVLEYLTLTGDGINAGAMTLAGSSTLTVPGLITANGGVSGAGWNWFIGGASGGMGLGSGHAIAWASGTTNQTVTGDLYLVRGGAAALQLGQDVNGAAVSQQIQAANGVTGSDRSGGSLTLASGKGTGAGAVSSLIFQTPTVLGSGTTAQSLATRVTIDSSGLTIADAMNIVLNATTGTKIGTATTQKLGFWNVTPVVQQVLATGASHTVDDVITTLQTLGLVKQS